MTVNVSPALLTKNVDAKRRNEELGRNAPEPLSRSFEGRVHDLGLLASHRRWCYMSSSSKVLYFTLNAYRALYFTLKAEIVRLVAKV